MEAPCQVIERDRRVTPSSPSFTLRLNLAGRLRAESWENRLTGQRLALRAGSEFSCTVDSARHRFDLPGWRLREGGPESRAPRSDIGAREKWFDPFFNDSSWCEEMTGYSHLMPAMRAHDYETNQSARRFLWARAVILCCPGDAAGTQAALRAHWSNNGCSANVVADVPSVSRLEANRWGTATAD
jgi:hypothetical protein